jgi:hypothetical protein
MISRFWKRVLFFSILLSLFIFANDGAYTLSGNQLIPIHESNISIKKEVLTITRVDDGILDVKVDYTFFNPSEAKTVLVGFEANEPSGDVDGTPKNGEHPYMKSFYVMINGRENPYRVAIDTDNDYLKNGKIISEDVSATINDKWFNGNDSGIGYVYYFNASFKKGINHVTHHYRYVPSGGVSTYFEIDYVLTAASRWAGGVIEDFTLVVDVGDYEEFRIAKGFFTNASEWQFDGTAKDVVGTDQDPNDRTKYSKFYLRKSPLVFKKKNFKIKGDLSLISFVGRYGLGGIEEFDYKKHKLPFRAKIYNINELLSEDRTSYKILNNLPYARRGYVFKNKKIQDYYEDLEWYEKDLTYKASVTHLVDNEKKWFAYLNETTLKILQNLPYAKRGYIFKNKMLDSYFMKQKWYKKNTKYHSSVSSLTKKEQAWRLKVKALKKDRGVDFYGLLDEYNAIYDNCLHKHEKEKVYDFMRRFILMDKKQIKARFSKKDTSRIEEDLINDLSLEITQETLDYYAKGYSDEDNTFEIELHEDEKNQGCYEYLYIHSSKEGNEYGFFIGIAKENGIFKIVRLSMAG